VLGCRPRCVAKMTKLRAGVMEKTVINGSQFIINSLPNRKPMKRI